MPTYHSTFNTYQGGTPICGTVILPLRTKVKGPAPPATAPNDRDIIDESVEYFRANVLHRNFAISGAADLTLVYTTAFIAELLREFTKYKSKSQAKTAIVPLAVSNSFALPGGSGWAFPGYFKAPENAAATESFKSYFRQIREETAMRLLDVVYDANGEQNKWWMMFSKRKFMNITKVT